MNAPDPQNFELEPPPVPGKISEAVIDELRNLHTMSNDASTDFREAIKLQSDKYKLKASALRRYIVALGRDKIDHLRAEAECTKALIGD